MKIGIYGGTFDPPHMGHFRAAQAAVERLGLDRLLLIPAALPPHKDLGKGAAPAGQRLAMAALMADGLCLETGRPGAVTADRLELKRHGKSFTADTLEEIRERYPDDQLFLLMGSDMFLSFQSWYEPRRIARLCTLAAFSRENGDGAALEAQRARLDRELAVTSVLIPLPQVTALSSSDLRAELATGAEGVAEGMWCQVYGYILMHGLYESRPELKHLSDRDLRCVSWSMVKAKRIPHIRGTEEEAARLADRWGADPLLARRAAILHDCTKYLDLEGQLHLCQTYDIPLDDLERGTVKLLHSKTGAAIARHVFGMPNEIYWAIYWHTTGKADMTTLEKVLYLADYIEPSRSGFDGLDRLRKLAYKDLDGALLLGCELTIEDMTQRGHVVHFNTSQARAFLKGRME